MEHRDQHEPPDQLCHAEADQDAVLRDPGELPPDHCEVQQREQDVEVLLHSQRPDNVHAQRQPCVPAQHHSVVVEVEQQAEDANAVSRRPVHHKVREGSCQTEDHIQRHKDTQRSSDVEVAQVDSSRALQLASQQRGNQVAAQKKEDGNAQRRRDVVADSGQRMSPEDQQEGDRADAVQPGNVRAA